MCVCVCVCVCDRVCVCVCVYVYIKPYVLLKWDMTLRSVVVEPSTNVTRLMWVLSFLPT